MLQLGPTLRPHGLWPSRLLCPRDSPGKSTGAGCQALLQGIFPTQGSNLSPALAVDSLPLSHQVFLITKKKEKNLRAILENTFFFFFFKFWGRARRVPSQAQPQKQNLGATAGKKKKNTQNPLTGQHPPPARGETWKTLFFFFF